MTISVKITLSYETETELQEAIKLLGKKVLKIKIPRQQAGKFKKAYIVLKDSACK